MITLRRRSSAYALVAFFSATVLVVALVGTTAAEQEPLPYGLQPISRDDTSGALDAARQFISAIEQGDGALLLAVIHEDALIERVARGMDFSATERSQFGAAMKATLATVGEVMAASAPDGIDATYRGLFARRGGMHALIRLDLGDLGLNYFELKLARTPEGEVLVYDWYDYAQAADYSANVRELGALASGDPELIASAGGVPGIDSKGAAAALRFMQQLQAGEYAPALETYKALPPGLANTKPLLLQRAKIANMTGNEKEYHAAMADMAKYHGGDPRLALLLVDSYYYAGDRESLFGALDRMKWFMGIEDAGLLNLEAAYHQLFGESALAEQRARAAIEREPGYEDPHWVLVQALLSQSKYAEVTHALRLIDKRFGGVDPSNIAAQPLFADYAQSESFQQWSQATPAAAGMR